jgi:hypothetical protein
MLTFMFVPQRTPYDGDRMVATLRKVLSREVRFINWKSIGCPPFELPPLSLSLQEEEVVVEGGAEEEESKKKTKKQMNPLFKMTSHAFAKYKSRPAANAGAGGGKGGKRLGVSSTVASAQDALSAISLLSGYLFDYTNFAHVKAVAKHLVHNTPTYEHEIQVNIK